MVSAVKGYRCIITMPDNATPERVKIMKAYGAEVILTPASLRMQGAIDEASTESLVKCLIALSRCNLRIQQMPMLTDKPPQSKFSNPLMEN